MADDPVNADAAGGFFDSSIGDALSGVLTQAGNYFFPVNTSTAGTPAKAPAVVAPQGGVTLPPASGALGTPKTAQNPGSFYSHLSPVGKGLLWGAVILGGLYVAKKVL